MATLRFLNSNAPNHFASMAKRGHVALAGKSGFTLIELAGILVIVAILAVAVTPRFFSQSVFANRAVHDEMVAFLRYAQKSAVAQRRNVCVAFTGSSATLTISANAGPAASCSNSLTGPDGQAPYRIDVPAGFASVPAAFHFTALGQASAGQTLSIAGHGVPIRIEAETGYVY
ncbi:MAG TPA: hypothetical protein VM406_04010 [Noviherbaspirillum sp.]|nr:hypothetical protein [Noviherbaspirillum sp.]